MTILTPRQAAIVELVARGLSDKAIARETGLSVDTVRQHIQRAANRLPGEGRPRHRLTLWFFNISDEDSAA